MTNPWALTNEIMLNIMQTLNLIFSKVNFRLTGVYVLSSISKALHNFYTAFFPMYRGILELKNNTRIFVQNGLFSYKTCCGLTALFLKMKISFCCCNFVNKQIIAPKIFQKMIVALEMELQIYGHLLKMLLYNMIIW